MKRIIFLLAIIISLSGCSTIKSMLGLNYSTQQRSQSSIVEFLYPNSRGNIRIQPKVPNLNIPLQVGIAFVPEACGTYRRHDLNEELKTSLLKRVSSQFENKEFIETVKVIPGTYLRRKGSFNNLRDIKRQFNVDIMVLLSYDQVQYTERKGLSLIYHWTVIGQYIFKGDKNDTITLLNSAVYDIESEELLFSSSGDSKVKSSTASAFISEELRLNSQKGFDLGIDNLIEKIDKDLSRFKQQIKSKTVAVKVRYRSGGGGAVSFYSLILFIGLFVFRYFLRYKKV